MLNEIIAKNMIENYLNKWRISFWSNYNRQLFK